MHRQIQGEDAVTAVDGLKRLRVNTRLGERLSEEEERVALADGLRHRDAVGRVNGQVQGKEAVAAVDGLQCFGVNALFRERLSEEEERVALTDSLRHRDAVGRVDGQVQDEEAVAAVDGLQRLGVNACFGERLSEEEECVALTDGIGQRDTVGRVYRQTQGEEAVAAVDGLERLRVNTRFGERLSEEEESVALTDGFRHRDTVGRVDGQVQGEEAVAAVDGLQHLGV